MTNSKPGRPEIAAIMPAFNPGKEIVWTLNSLRAQTVPFKLFVTDDGSRRKPDYHALLKGLDYHLIELPENVGVCTVRNASIEAALDEGFAYIAIIDCGDWAFPERLARQLAFMKDNPGIGAVGSAVEILHDDMSYDHDFTPPSDPAGIRKSLFYGLAFKHPAMMFRAGLLRQVGLYSPEFDAAEDYDLVRRAARVADLANLSEVLMKKVESLNSVSAVRRTAQLVSRFRIQLRYPEPLNVHYWLGLGKTIIVLVAPTKLVARVRPWIHPRRAPRIDAEVLDV